MNKKYLIIGAILLVGGYIAYKKFFVEKEEVNEIVPNEPTTSNVPASTNTIFTESKPVTSPAKPVDTVFNVMSDNSGVVAQNVTTQSSLPSANYSNVSYAGLGKY